MRSVLDRRPTRSHQLSGSDGGEDQQPKLVRAPTRTGEDFRPSVAPPVGSFAALVSHCKADAAMEARFLQQELEDKLGRAVFLDSDDLRDLTKLQQHVRDSATLVLVQSTTVLERPYCIFELVTACDHGTPIVGVKLEGSAYDFAHAAAPHAPRHDAGAGQPGRGQDARGTRHQPDRCCLQLANTIPKIISIGFNPSAPRTILAATITDTPTRLGRW